MITLTHENVTTNVINLISFIFIKTKLFAFSTSTVRISTKSLCDKFAITNMTINVFSFCTCGVVIDTFQRYFIN